MSAITHTQPEAQAYTFTTGLVRADLGEALSFINRMLRVDELD